MDDESGSEPQPARAIYSDEVVKKNNRTAWLIQGVILAVIVGMFLFVGIVFATAK